MPSYRRLGSIPPKRHIKHHRPEAESHKGEGIFYEHVITTEGFARAYSITYHLRPPTRVRKSERVGTFELEPAGEQPLQADPPHDRRFAPRRGCDLGPRADDV